MVFLHWLVLLILPLLGSTQYSPDWSSIDSRPLPQWFDDAKFGIFVHWGVYSVPSFKSEWYWWYLNGTNPDPETIEFHRRVYGKDFKYADFARYFTAEMFDPDEWASIFKEAGARYVVFTSKHHEGFTNWPSSASWNWNSMDIGPHRDLVGDLSAALRRVNLTVGMYYSLFEWFNPLFLQDKANNFATRVYCERKMMPELHDLILRYKPEILWSDGDWDADSVTYWHSPEFLAWLYNDSPVKDTVVTNDRWGRDCGLRHGGYYSGADRQGPSEAMLRHKWEKCMTIDAGSWGYSRHSNLAAYLSPTEILRELISTVAFGGNLLLNVGPTKDGLILPIFQERLSQVGQFLRINGEAIYGTRPFITQNETGIEGAFYTAQRRPGHAVYLLVVQETGTWPIPKTTLHLLALNSLQSAELLTAQGPVEVPCVQEEGHVQCSAPCPYAAGLAQGSVHPLGFVLRLQGAVAQAHQEGSECYL